MQISSMTGFARENGKLIKDEVTFEWVWELKSVNGKTLDVKSKLPSWLDEISLEIKNIAQKYFERGSLSAFLDLTIANLEQNLNINQSLLEQLTKAAIELYEKHDTYMNIPSASELLSIIGVVELEKRRFNEEITNQLKESILKSFEACCLALQKDRQNEGAKIKKVLENMVLRIETIVGQISGLAALAPQNLKEKLQLQLKELLEGNVSISEDRLAQEVVLLVNRADIREEIDRLNTHIATAREMLAKNQTLGRKFDFLCQEFNREANTTCSKASNVEIINLGMELKATVEQLREQVQNME